jgi:hypothetical protein
LGSKTLGKGGSGGGGGGEFGGAFDGEFGGSTGSLLLWELKNGIAIAAAEAIVINLDERNELNELNELNDLTAAPSGG